MSVIPKLALFRSSLVDELRIAARFPRESFIVRGITDLDELQQLTAEEQSPFDAAIVLLRDSGCENELLFLRQIVANAPLMSTTPPVVICDGVSPETRASLLDSGVEHLLPVESSNAELQAFFTTLYRRLLATQQQIQVNFESTALRHGSMEALNLTREGLVLFSGDFALQYLNTAAGFLLGLSAESTDDDIAETAEQFISLIERFQRAGSPAGGSFARRQIIRADKQRFPGVIRLQALPGNSWAVGVIDAAEWDGIEAKLRSADTVRATALAALGGLMQQAKGRSLTTTLRSLSVQETRLESFGTILLEVLDLLLPNSLNVRLSPPPNVECTVPPSLLMNLTTRAVFEALDVVGAQGEISLGFSISEQGLLVALSATSGRPISFLPPDYLSAILNSLEEQRERPLSDLIAEHPEVVVARGWHEGQYRIQLQIPDVVR